MKLPRHEFPGAAGGFPNRFQNRQLPPMRDIAFAKSSFLLSPLHPAGGEKTFGNEYSCCLNA